MNSIVIREKAKNSRNQPYFGDWKKIYKPLSNYLKQIIHAENTKGILFPNADYLYNGSIAYREFPFEEYHVNDVIKMSNLKESATFLKGLSDKHKELNELGIFCIVSFHNFNKQGRLYNCFTWVHLKTLEIIYRHTDFYVEYEYLNIPTQSIDDVSIFFKNMQNNFKALEDWKRVKILIGYKVKTNPILSLIYSFLEKFNPIKRLKFMELSNRFSMLNQEQISSLWKSD